MSTTVIFGAGSLAELFITKELYARNWRIRSVHEGAPPAPSLGTEHFSGSVSDDSFVQRICAGAQAVVVVAPPGRAETNSIARLLREDLVPGATLGVVGCAASPSLGDKPCGTDAMVTGASPPSSAVQVQTPGRDWFTLCPSGVDDLTAPWMQHKPGRVKGNRPVCLCGAKPISGEDYASAFVDALEMGSLCMGVPRVKQLA